LEQEREDQLVNTDRKYHTKYEVRFTKQVTAFTAPMVTHIACTPTNTQCSTSFGQSYIWLCYV